MSKDFVPDSVQNTYDWASQLYTEITTSGAAAGWDAARITAFQALVGPIRDAAKAVLDAQDALDIAKGALGQARVDNLAEIRREIKNLKTSPGYNDGLGKSLGVHSAASATDPNSYQAQLDKAVAYAGYVRITATKLMADSLNIYSRIKGQGTFKLLASKRVHFPFDDDSPLAQPGTPETREYQAIGVQGDDEFGQPSEIISVLYGG
jgi:hypothetical protein